MRNYEDPFATQSPFSTLERTQRQRFMTSLSISAFAFSLFFSLLYGVLYFFEPSWQLAVGFAQGVPSVALSLLALRLTRRGKPEQGAFIILPYLLFLVGFLSVLFDVTPGIAPAYISFIIVAAMVWGPAAGIGLALLATFLWTLAVLFPEWGVPLKQNLGATVSSIIVLAITSMSFIFAAFVSQAATGGLWRALKDAARHLIQANRELQAANRTKSQFVARMSHDLRSPLNAIILSNDLMLRELYGPVKEKQKEALQRSLNSARRLEALIADVLDISKIESGQMELVEEPVALQALLETLQAIHEPRARDKGLEFDIIVAPDMPTEILADERRLGQVLTNLTDNAINFTDDGEVNVIVEPSNRDHWHVAIRDTGCGIHEADLEIIFEEFRQAETAPSTNRASGTGLGLSIARHFVRLMEGDIQVTSKIGKGSEFDVILPLKLPNGKPNGKKEPEQIEAS